MQERTNGPVPPGDHSAPAWLARLRHRRARRALERQLAYQQAKARAVRGREDQVVLWMKRRSHDVRSRLHSVRPIPPNPRVLEVGSGAHGLVFFFGSDRAIGADPLAAHYAGLFPLWQRRVPTIAAAGEALPFANGSFDVVLCDNVIDHAERPGKIVAELSRVLAPSGLLYFTVHVHHPLYAAASALHGAWNGLGLRYEITPFADHTVHLTTGEAKRLFQPLPLRIAEEAVQVRAAAPAGGRLRRPMVDLLTRIFFKNADYEVIAVREA